MTIGYRVVGSGSPVVVCGGGPSTTYAYLVEDLSPLGDDAALTFHDYRGSGTSSSGPDDTFTFEQLADDIAALAAHLRYDTIDIVAHSMGGMVGLPCARCGTRVWSVVWC